MVPDGVVFRVLREEGRGELEGGVGVVFVLYLSRVSVVVVRESWYTHSVCYILLELLVCLDPRLDLVLGRRDSSFSFSTDAGYAMAHLASCFNLLSFPSTSTYSRCPCHHPDRVVG